MSMDILLGVKCWLINLMSMYGALKLESHIYHSFLSPALSCLSWDPSSPFYTSLPFLALYKCIYLTVYYLANRYFWKQFNIKIKIFINIYCMWPMGIHLTKWIKMENNMVVIQNIEFFLRYKLCFCFIHTNTHIYMVYLA